MNQGEPSKEELLRVYHWLDEEKHPHRLLRLETRLPTKLQRESRDEYRILMTMILSEETDDYTLSLALRKFFLAYPDMNSLEHLDNMDDARNLLRYYGFKTEGYKAERNVKRFCCLNKLYFGQWNANFLPDAIATLETSKMGYGQKFTRTLRAYWKGEQYVLPLDGQGLKALHAKGYYERDKNGSVARVDIESKLKDVADIFLIDFHELLRFRGQTGGRPPEHFTKADIKVVIGWNAWRLLCSSKRAEITEDWIYTHLVTDESITRELWGFLSGNQ